MATRGRKTLLLLGAALAAALAPGRSAAACVGDCGGAGRVSIANLIVGVNISLGRQDLASCEAFDENGNGSVEINELIRGVGNALRGCPVETVSPTPAPTPTVGGGVQPGAAEIQVNTFTANGQSNPAAANVDGGFEIAWQSRGDDGDDYGIFARRFDADAQPAGDAGQVNETTVSAQRFPAVAAEGAAYVVVWSSYGQDGDADGLFARRFAADGSPAGSEFAVNQYTTRDQSYASIAVQDSGSFLVVWESNGQDGNGRGVFARRFDGQGTALRDEFQVNESGTGDQRRPAVAILDGGAFAVAWMDDRVDGDGRGIVARRLASDGSPVGSEFAVNSFTSGDQAYPAVAAEEGGFVVAWESDGQDGDGRGIFARFFAADGSPRGEEFQVNSTTTGNQRRPRLSADGDGGFVACWESSGEAGSVVLGQRYDSLARARGSEFVVPASTAVDARRPTVARAGSSFVVAWETYPDGDGDGYGVAARRFDLLP